VRAVWDDEHAKWWFSVVDVVGVLNEESDHVKAGNYLRWLKRKLIKADVQFVSGTHRLKLTAAGDLPPKQNSLKVHYF
jgi:cell filamentation protein